MDQPSQDLTPKRGEKAAPKSRPGAWDKPERQAHATKNGPGRKATNGGVQNAPRTAAAPVPLKKLRANVGRVDFKHPGWYAGERRVWREGEPVHVVKPNRAARIAAKKAAEVSS